MTDTLNSPFEGLPENAELLVAFSGGVDSSVAAFLCKEAGFRVRAVTLFLSGRGNPDEKKLFSAASALDIPLEILELSEEFEACVVRYAWEEYAHARTPNPCAICNPLFKFGKLKTFAESLRCRGLVTGHYARIVRTGGGTRLFRGADHAKDQSYFLFGLSPEQLAFSRFPLGGMCKADVRGIARSLSLASADAPESQDICFAPPDSARFGETLRTRFRADAVRGRFVAPDGRRLGVHTGIHNYTIGQRKGTNVALGVPAYVKSIDAATGDIILATDEKELFSKRTTVRDPNWIPPEYGEKTEFDCTVRVRYRSKGVPAHVSRRSARELEVEFSEPQRAVAPGQAAVFYAGDELVGGGWIV